MGISELHQRKASPLHICCASIVKAKPALADNVEIDIANVSAKPARRIARLRKVVMLAPISAAARGARLMLEYALSRNEWE